jgi:hypothetical protein
MYATNLHLLATTLARAALSFRGIALGDLKSVEAK